MYSIDIQIIRRYQKRLQKKIGDQIGSKVLEEAYNHFLEHNTSKGYKFYWDNGNVYIVSMAKSEHGGIVLRLIRYFGVPNGGVDDDPPIDLTLQACKKSL